MRKPALVVALWLALPAFGAATGRVVGPDGAPIAGAEVCEFVEAVPERCVKADAAKSSAANVVSQIQAAMEAKKTAGAKPAHKK